MLNKLTDYFFRPIDAASIAVFRIGFGFVMFADAIGHLGFVDLDSMYVTPVLFFKYYGFEWVPVLREGVYWVYGVSAIASLGLMFGWHYRLSAAIVAICNAAIFLQDQAQYLNHLYLLILFSSLMVFVPAHRYWSLDAKRRPNIASDTLPTWCLILLIVQLEIILIYAGLVKINPDWLQLEPLASWLAKRQAMPLVGQLFVDPTAVAIAAYGVIALHLVGAPLLLFKRTRLYVIGVYACFHTLNHFVFDIGVFPWVTLFASLLCFSPDWPRQFWAKLRRLPYHAPQLTPIALPGTQVKTAITLSVCAWLVFQTLVPARNLLYQGEVAWNEGGHRFSWRMKLRSKQGSATFYVKDPVSGKQWKFNPRPILNRRQNFKMPCQPDMIWQMAQYVQKIWAPQQLSVKNAEVTVRSHCRLNYRKLAMFIDPKVDLTKVPRDLGNNEWVLPLTQPLKPKHLPDWFPVSH
ncbi:hypothetical protein EZV61_15045 [Corallincola luteus]|uniref:HTTM-like domain-containing protein n=2 Tax=Corallincola TaxID=1775176 RepID=A0A368N8P3_9GAMM|nr:MULTISPECIES: HTTM domain-containing protein [Corallincola]RCU45639.1 hypothetical protein DU002_14335 [Corallincola holothuriorum]TCI02245.1 hypothetical protein EZV61_15045 [Corallincola luteus]